ncbi:MNIO family bufferin maturase [Variovorax sp. JS1663]|uniref:MNIO family bufferin maturase n=1 Tax=Variovorax sp. JS1663 TaxID=1851577 RepID=UPI000B349FF0|nr:DUF692 domain-containing protein [Variovorax sp. JS1663]OUM03008.1 hypothetical protein A8M77_08710 [Variovorax sp. JS1663]
MQPTPPSLSGRTGIGLRPEHWRAFTETRPPVGFIEAHSENYFGRGGKPLHFLLLARESHALSLHGVGLSIGSVDPLCERHLGRLAELVRMLEPDLVSDHLCWTSVGGVHANDLLPLPYTEEALAHVVARVQRVQDFLGRPILLENLSAYLDYAQSTVPEWEFLAEVADRSGCGVLLDINNIHVSAHNLGFDPLRYIDALPRAAVREMHLAGFTRNVLDDGAEILIDTHSAPVADAVWALYAAAIERFGPVPTLVEWDADLPPLPALVAEAEKARAMMEALHACAV